jgi:hypothetical protein
VEKLARHGVPFAQELLRKREINLPAIDPHIAKPLWIDAKTNGNSAKPGSQGLNQPQEPFTNALS